MATSLIGADWGAMFTPRAPIAETVVRGTVIHHGLFRTLRPDAVRRKREAGGVSIGDDPVVVLLADASRNSLAPDSRALPGGVLLVATIILRASALNWPGYHVPGSGRMVHPEPVRLVRHGQPTRATPERELTSREEPRSKARAQRHADPDDLASAWMEGDGRISVILGEGGRGVSHKA